MSLGTVILKQSLSALKKHGTVATLGRVTSGAYNVATGIPAAGSSSTDTVYAQLDATSLKSLGFRYGHDLVRAGDLQATIAASGMTLTPQAGDTLTIGSAVYTVVASRPTYYQATPILYELLVRL